jgi:phenylalanyl-tRNA synthetase beta chain
VKISTDWLNDHVDLAGLRADELAELLTVRTAEVEGVEVMPRPLSGLVVAEVLSAEPLEADGKLSHHVQVGLGDRSLVTVCGAPNVRVGMRAVFAPAGCRLSNGEVVQVAQRYGRASEGVLCAPGEIGLGAGKEGLLELPADLQPGTLLSTLLPDSDTLIEIDNKSLTHRPDLWGHYGFARELAAIFGRPLRPWAADALPRDTALPAWGIEVEDADDCPLYSALALRVNGDRPSPLRMQSRLLTLGHGARSLLVDVTNYVQFELGQPTHAFDARCLSGVRVARAGARTHFTTLDGKDWRLAPGDLLIHDGDEPVALAGIMGGLASRIQPDTREVVLESATFKASRVRQTSVRLGLRTDSSLRFEKKPPPVFTRLATGRILRLLREAGADPRPLSRYSVVGDFRERPRTITLAPGWLSRRAGVALADSTVDGILTSIGLTVERAPDGALAVTVPAFRSEADLAIPEDISEEVFRLYGYDNIKPVAPAGPLAPVPPHPDTRNQHRARRILSEAHGFVEVQTYSWHADDWLAQLGYAPEGTLRVLNPSAPTRGQLRNTLVPNLLAAAHQNRNADERFRIYELGRIFWLDSDGQKREANELAGVIVDQSGGTAESCLRAARSAIEDLAQAAGLAVPTFAAVSAPAEAPWIRPGRTLLISQGGTPIGHLGVLPEALASRCVNTGHVAWFRLASLAWEGEAFPAPRYVAPPTFPGSWQDFTLTHPVASGWAGLCLALDGFSHPLVHNREFVTMYQPKGSLVANYSVRFVLRLADRTPEQADLDAFRGAFLSFMDAAGLGLAG